MSIDQSIVEVEAWTSPSHVMSRVDDGSTGSLILKRLRSVGITTSPAERHVIHRSPLRHDTSGTISIIGTGCDFTNSTQL